MKRTPLLIVLVVAVTTWGQAAFAGDDVPWWEQEKIRFMWGQWSRIEGDGVPMSEVIETWRLPGARSSWKTGRRIGATRSHRSDSPPARNTVCTISAW